MTQIASPTSVITPTHDASHSFPSGEPGRREGKGKFGRLVRSRWFGLTLLGLACTVGGALLWGNLRPDPPSETAKPARREFETLLAAGGRRGEQADRRLAERMLEALSAPVGREPEADHGRAPAVDGQGLFLEG